jgi:hypothetical protein
MVHRESASWQANENAQLFEAVLDVLKKDYGVRVENS